MVSSTVTVALLESMLLFTSVTLKYTVLAPTSEQLKLVMSKLIPWMVQLSLLLLSMSPVVMLAEPLASRYTVMS